jgi:hypothetical protein
MTVINELKKYVPKIHILGSNSVFNISSKNTHNCKFKMGVNNIADIMSRFEMFLVLAIRGLLHGN